MRRFRRILLALVILLLIAVATGIVTLRSDWFLEQVRTRIIAELEKATGGRAEIGSLAFDWNQLRARAGGIVLHGLEPADAAPLLRIQSLETGLKIKSLWARDVDVQSLLLRRPEVHIEVAPDGTSNLPAPKLRGAAGATWAENLIRLKVARFEAIDGTFEYNGRQIPLDILAEKLNAKLDFEIQRKLYRGELKAQSVRVEGRGFGPLTPAVDAAFTIDAKEIRFSKLLVDTKSSHADLKGALTNLDRPRGDFSLKANVSVADLPKSPIVAGSGAIDGELHADFGSPFDFGIKGKVFAKNVSYRDPRVRIDGGSAHATVDLSGEKLTIKNVRALALGAEFQGEAEILEWKRWKVDGDVDHADAREILKALAVRTLPWNGVLAGPVHLEGVRSKTGFGDTKIRVNVAIAPAGDGPALTGLVDLAYDQKAGTIQLGESYVATTATRADVSGTLGAELRVRAQSADLNDIRPVLELLGQAVSEKLPVELRGGSVKAEGQVTGPIDNPHFTGSVQGAKLGVEGHPIEKLTADVDVGCSVLKASKFSVEHPLGSATGSGQVQLSDWKLAGGAISAQVEVRGAQLAKLAAEFGQSIPADGVLAATAKIAGTVDHPAADVVVTTDKLISGGETFSKVRVEGHFSGRAIEVNSVRAETAGSRLEGRGRLDHPENDYKNGTFQAEGSAEALSLGALAAWRDAKTDVDARLQAKLAASGRLVNGQVELSALNGEGSLRNLTLETRRLGDLNFSMTTQGSSLTTHASLDLRGEKIEGSGEWKLDGNYDGSAQIRFPRLSATTLHDLRPALGGWDQLPFDGFISGSAVVTGSLKKLGSMQAEVSVDAVQVSTKASQKLRLGVQSQDVTLKSSKPFKVLVTRDLARVSGAQFTAQNTNLEMSGQIGLQPKVDSALVLKGAMNLSILQLINADLLAQGAATLNATVRGSMSNPVIRGRLDLKNASLYLTDLPNGVDNANGSIVFDNGRATVEKLTAETGGGQIRFSGFMEYGGTALVYRLQAQAESVRIRYPEDLSVTFNSQLSLSGTSENSVLAGTVSVNKMSFQPRTDLGQLLAASTKPVPTIAAPSEYLRGMQFDVHIESGPEMQVNTSLSSNVQADIDMRLRGSPIRPALLGSVSVDTGDIQIFGNRYTINRGEIRFFNPVKIEPVFDMDLETKARAITVNISFSGTLNKLNVTYRSDPPLQTREIIALLAVGRDPGSISATGTGSVNAQSSFLQAGNSLLGQAVSAQLSNRLQRFFGVSRVKIDPQLTGVDALPQARLTLEQQVSRDVTITYITNLNRTQEQIVRFQWDLSKEWSMIAVRDTNGVFGVDFEVRKRFK